MSLEATQGHPGLAIFFAAEIDLILEYCIEGEMGKHIDKRERLDSWKEISLYLNRTIRTSYRWCKDLDLPVYRVDKRSIRSRVFAFRDEIDKWFEGRINPQARQTGLGRTGAVLKRTRKKNISE